LFLLKPRIEISDVVFKNSGYQIQIVNRSIFKAYDVRVELWQCSKETRADGELEITNSPIAFVISNIFQLPHHAYPWQKSNPSCTARFRTHADLDAIYSAPGNSLLFLLTARHGLSGLTRVYRKEYPSKKYVKQESFS